MAGRIRPAAARPARSRRSGGLEGSTRGSVAGRTGDVGRSLGRRNHFHWILAAKQTQKYRVYPQCRLSFGKSNEVIIFKSLLSIFKVSYIFWDYWVISKIWLKPLKLNHLIKLILITQSTRSECFQDL